MLKFSNPPDGQTSVSHQLSSLQQSVVGRQSSANFPRIQKSLLHFELTDIIPTRVFFGAMDVEVSNADRSTDNMQVVPVLEPLATADESAAVALESFSQSEPSVMNDAAPASTEVAKSETISEACARILKGLAALKVTQNLALSLVFLVKLKWHALL